MVNPTQAVPEVLAVWGSDYKKAIVCRRYTIMVAQKKRNHPKPTVWLRQIPDAYTKTTPHIMKKKMPPGWEAS